MASFLSEQLDFIFFFYGLAFILLGATCSRLAGSQGAGQHWAILGGFGFVHGVAEWLDLTALIVGDSPVFAMGRTTVMTASFFLLMEFARRKAIRLGLSLPGRWVYPLLALAIAFVGVTQGVVAANIVARYSAGFAGALGTSLALAWSARSLPGLAKGLTLSASAGFAFYAIAAGLIVPAGSIWPSTVINHGAFSALTAMPIQLVRGLLACWISFSIWAAWSQRLASDVSSPRYTAYVHHQFVWTVAATGVILLSGWALTEHLGEIYKRDVEKRAASDIELLASRLAGETAATEAMVRSLAGAPSVLPLLSGGTRGQVEAGQSVLDLDIAASGAKRGYILNRLGDVVASSNDDGALAGSLGHASAPYFLKSMAGVPAYEFVFEPGTGKHDYYASYPIKGGDHGVVGVAVLTRSLDGFEADLRQFGRPYFFVDPDGVVMMSNQPEAMRRTLWPLSEARRLAVASRIGTPVRNPMFESGVVDGVWTSVDGVRNFVRRRFANHSDWSLVILKPTREIFASRFLGIVITLLVTIVGLVYMATKERKIHDDVVQDSRLRLQKLAQDLRVKATTDPLTGLFNRGKLTPMLLDEMKRVDRYNTPLSLVMFDIDHFKAINDTHGHLIGDQVLVQLSRLVQKQIRSNDLLARWGGEEFLIMLPGSDGPKAFGVAEKLREAIAGTDFGAVGSATCSFGVAQYVPGDAPDQFLARADAALYLAKNGGRNRVKLAPQPDRETAEALRA